MRIVAFTTLFALALPTLAADVLLDNYAAEKARIASAYKNASAACTKHAPSVADACRTAAQTDRRNALQAASEERDTGLKCRTTCGLVNEIKHDAATGATKKEAWHVSYTLYSGDAQTADFDHDPHFAAGDKIGVQDGKLIKR